MTEIPEHLLKRSKERRAAMGGAPRAATPLPRRRPSRLLRPPLRPLLRRRPLRGQARSRREADPPYVKAAKERKKIPYWAMGTLSLLPIFVFMYWRGLTEQEEAVEGPIGYGAEIYAAACSGCHMPGGVGGVGRQLNEGEVLATFPAINDQMNFIWVAPRDSRMPASPSTATPSAPTSPTTVH